MKLGVLEGVFFYCIMVVGVRLRVRIRLDVFEIRELDLVLMIITVVL